MQSYSKELEEYKEKLEKYEAKLEEYEHLFDRMWEADMRGIEKWRKAHPDSELVWPDRANLIEWLLGELDKHESNS